MSDSCASRLLALHLAAALTLSVGCSSGNGLTLARVVGKVTYKGMPIKKGTVFFMPDDAKGTVGPPAVGTITADGSYVMSTESAGDGVIVGSHKVGITGLDESPVDSTPAPTPEANPQEYMKAKAKDAAAARSSTPSKKAEAETFTDRGGARWRFLIPKKLTNPQESGIIAKVESGRNTFNFDIDESGQVKITK